jgi:hypothetical protein
MNGDLTHATTLLLLRTTYAFWLTNWEFVRAESVWDILRNAGGMFNKED